MRLLHSILRALFPGTRRQIDLHGLRIEEALGVVATAVADAREEKIAQLHIICGKGLHSPGGVGVLRNAVCGWLDRHGYSGRYRREVDRDGRDGTIVVEIMGSKDNRSPSENPAGAVDS